LNFEGNEFISVSGKVMEYDAPMNLMEREDSLFGQLVKEFCRLFKKGEETKILSRKQGKKNFSGALKKKESIERPCSRLCNVSSCIEMPCSLFLKKGTVIINYIYLET
jgi:hypothetical protein